jgi:starch-binding outer membrane protein, SusD/RagB family
MNTDTSLSFRRTGYNLLVLVLPVLLATACADFVDVDTPKTEVTGPSVYRDDATATASVVGIYAKMTELPYFNSAGIQMLTGLSADEFTNSALYSYGGFEENQLSAGEFYLLNYLWQPGYKFIYQANDVLEGLANSEGVSAPVRRSLQGQAHFVRALCYFYLVNLFGDLPKVTSTDYRVNLTLQREPVDSIYALIEWDLEQASRLLPRDFATSYEEERTLPTTSAAHALCARMALYRNRWSQAAREADSVIARAELFELPAPDAVFNYDSREAIWQVKQILISTFAGTWEAQVFQTLNDVYLRPTVLEAMEPDDVRTQWIGITTLDGTDMIYYPYKYRYLYTKVEEGGGLEYHIEFRLAEQYLIRAEARAHLGDFDGAIADLDVIRVRAGLPRLADLGIAWTQDLVLERVAQERRVELFTEGHRWFDLIRTGAAGAVLSGIEGKTWNATDVLYPVPEGEIRKNRKLEPQNEGYTN